MAKKDLFCIKTNRGYGLFQEYASSPQDWHREYDKMMEDWLQSNKNATLESFQQKLQEFYDRPDIVDKFGKVVVELFKKVVEE